MALGFSLFVDRALPLGEIRETLNTLAASLQFLPVMIEDGGWKIKYCRHEGEVGLSVLINHEPDHLEVFIHPVTEEHLRLYTPELLIGLFSRACIQLGADLGRSFPDTGYFVVQADEVRGPLLFVDWYQYFSRDIVNRWGNGYLREGPFYKVEEYPNGACGIWLAESPSERLGRTKAAEYLGVELPRVYGKNPQTGQQIEMFWD